VRQALMQTFVSQNLGLRHITREDVIRNHTRPLAQTLFGDITESQAIVKIVTFWDIYVCAIEHYNCL
jgi:hypothetical protein